MSIKRALNLFSRAYILVIFIALCIGIFSSVYPGTLPYLYELTLIERFGLWVSIWILGVGLFFLTASQSHLQYFIFEKKIEYLKRILSLVGMCFMLALVSSNIFGYLVTSLPYQHYENEFRVIETRTLGSYRRGGALALDLTDVRSRDFYYLELSKRRFDYRNANIKAGDTIIIEGHQNFFGVMVDSVKYQIK